jgi:hypothetical protein
MAYGLESDGRILQYETPEWRPLEEAVGEELAGGFMWMYEIATDDDRRIQAYKHIDTRCCLHLDGDGEAFAYVDESRYRHVDLAAVLEEVFEPWWERLRASPEEVCAAWAAIERARHR